MRTLLVTGGCGFIGSSFIRRTLSLRDDIRIINIDKLTYAGNLDNVAGIAEKYSGRYTFMYADICDFAAVSHTFNIYKPDAVVNFAAESHVDRSIVSPEPFIHTNIVGVGVLLEIARTHWPESDWHSRKFLQVSTDEVYGSLPEGMPGLKFTETSPLDPHSPYASSKASADLLVKSYGRAYGLPVLITRSSNNYGPRQFPEKLIPLMILRALEGRPLPVYGDGLNVRDWFHVDDHCDAILSVLDHAAPGSLYNIGGGNEMCNIDLVKLLLEILGKPESLINYVADRPGHDRRYAMDITKIRTELGWQPRRVFAESFAETVRWYSDNFGWLERIISGAYRLDGRTYVAGDSAPPAQI